MLAAAVPFVGATAQAAPLGATKINRTALNFPSALTVAPDGRIFFGERLTGRIGWVNPSTGAQSTFAMIRIGGTSTGRGLMSLAFHPRYPDQPYLYVSLTRLANGVPKM